MNIERDQTVDIYIIGGASRSGKSLLASRLAQELGLSVLPLDALNKSIAEARGDKKLTAKQKKQAEKEKDFVSKAKNEWPIYRALVDNIVHLGRDYCLEGEQFIPENIVVLESWLNAKQEQRNSKEPYKSKVGQVTVHHCFLGYADISLDRKIEQIKTYWEESSSTHDWTRGIDKQELRDITTKRIEYSKWLRNQCDEHSLNYVDTGDDFNEQIDNALMQLVGTEKIALKTV